MNCNQARTMLSAYRELNEIEAAELDAHLETCADCREILASYTSMGDQLRSTSVATPPPDMHAKLMKALADEQLKFLQKSAPGTVTTPEFLKSYVQERARETRREDDIAAFSTAETGPLPVLHTRRKRRPLTARVNQMGVFGLTAAALILLMLGGLTSLLVLERAGPSSPAISFSRNSISVNRPTEVDQKIYTTSTLYPNVTSALPNDNQVYYTASGNGVNSGSWMLMEFDRATQTSKPLLDTPSSEPLIVLAISHNWLVWLQYSRPEPTSHVHQPSASDYYTLSRAWKVYYLSLLPAPQNIGTVQNQTATGTNQGSHKKGSTSQPLVNDPELVDMPAIYQLAEGNFDNSAAPSWVNSPIGGSWLIGDTDTLLLTTIDGKGISHLESYQLSLNTKTVQAQEIAHAPAGHILAWPTATSTGLQIYWAEEWMTGDGTLRSNIWQQQTTEQSVRSHGQMQELSTSTQQIYQGDGLSFQPQVVDNTLFFLSTSEIKIESPGVVEPNGIPFPSSATDSDVLSTPRTDTGVYAAPPDASLHGTLLKVPLDGNFIGVKNMLGTVGQSTGYQAGGKYVIWQDDNGYQMYDVDRGTDVVTGDTLNSASLLVVNGDTTLWLATGNQADARLKLMAFTWPN